MSFILFTGAAEQPLLFILPVMNNGGKCDLYWSVVYNLSI